MEKYYFYQQTSLRQLQLVTDCEAGSNSGRQALSEG